MYPGHLPIAVEDLCDLLPAIDFRIDVRSI